MPMVYRWFGDHNFATSVALGPRVYAGIPGRDFLTFWAQDLAQEKSIEDQVKMFAARMPHALTRQIFAVDKDGVGPA